MTAQASVVAPSPASTQTRLLVRYLLAIMCLSVVTLLLVDNEARFERVSQVLPEGVPFAGGDWRHSRTGVSRIDAAPPELRLAAQDFSELSYFAMRIPQPHSYEYLRVSAEVRSDGLTGDAAPWHGGSLLLVSFDEKGGRLWFWPAVIARLKGTNAWHRVSQVIPVHADTKVMELIAYTAAQSGTLGLRAVRVDSVKETALFAGVRTILILAWVLAGVWVAYVLSSRQLRSPLRVASLASAAVIVAAGMVPQPHLNDALKRMLYGTQDMLFAAIDSARQIAEGAEHDGGADRGAVTATPDAGPTTTGEAVFEETHSGFTPGSAAVESPELHVDGDRNHSRYWAPDWQDLDKKEHLAAFFALGLLAGFAYRQYAPVRVLLSLAVLAGSIQAMQGLSITREPALGDLGYDLAGAALGAGMAYLLAWAGRMIPAQRASTG